LAGERLLLNATDGQRGFELWSTDGSAAGTRLVGDLCPGECSSFPLGYHTIGGRRFFLAHAADGPFNSFELWASDGTLAGTERLTDFDNERFGYPNVESVVTGTRMFFSAPDPQHGQELWVSDGTLAGTHLVRDIADEDLGGSFPAGFRAAGNRLYFAANDGDVYGHQLWRSDGTEEGTSLVDDVFTFQPPFHSSLTAAIGTDLVFTRTDVDGMALWRTDGTEEGTIQLSPSLRGIRSMTAVGGTVFFSARDQAFEDGLWKTDGTAAGTREVFHFGGVYDGWPPDELTPFGDGIIFRAGSLDHGIEPWRSDGTAAGTRLISDLEPGEGYHTLYGFQTIGGVTYFFGPGAPGLPGVGLWRTDGMAAGTVPVVQLGGVFNDHGPSWIAPLGAQLLIFLPSGLWATDGTQAGTRQISTATRYYSQPASEGPAAFGERVYFGAVDPVSQRFLLFVSNGTAEGTAPMLDAGGLPIENPSAVRVFGGRLTFAAAHGGEDALWQSDGTPAGTAPIFTLGPAYFGPHEMAAAGSRLYFSAVDHDHGEELWALPAEP
jgi:ELWxxDGT repeat protein